MTNKESHAAKTPQQSRKGTMFNSTFADAPVVHSERPRPLKIFRFKDSPVLEDTGMMTPGNLSEAIVQMDLENLLPGIGYEARVLFADTEVENGLSLVHAWFGPGFPLPTHSHNSDCLYYITRGSAIMGKDVLEAGDGLFVPKNAAYRYEAGPAGAEVLEIRTATSWDMQIIEQKPERWQANIDRANSSREVWLKEYSRRPHQ